MSYKALCSLDIDKHYSRLLKHAVTTPCLPTFFCLEFSLALHFCDPLLDLLQYVHVSSLGLPRAKDNSV